MENLEEPPKEITKSNVVYWSEHWKKLIVEGGEKAKGAKAKKFLENDCIEYCKEEKLYLCKPIRGYNKTIHKMKPIKGGFECSCQEYQTYQRTCSHILALYLFLKIENWNKKKDLNVGLDII